MGQLSEMLRRLDVRSVTTRLARATVLVLLVAAFVIAPGVGCGSRPTRPPVVGAQATSCDAAKPETCEAAIASALDHDEDPAPFLRTYVKGRSAAGDSSLENLLAALERAPRHALLVRFGPKSGAAPAAFDVPSAPRLTSLSLGSLLLAMGRVAKASLVVAITPENKTLRVYPSDPIAPLSGGMLPVALSAKPPAFEEELALEEAMRRATAAASAFDYVEATAAVDDIDAFIDAHDPFEIPTLRARSLSDAMGLSAPHPWSDATTTKKEAPPSPPEPTDDDTPYVDLMRVRLDGHATEWPKRSARLLRAFPEDRRPALVMLFSPSRPCGALLPPPITSERDLLFAGLLRRALLPAHARDTRGRVPLETWYAAYAALVGTVNKTDTAYLYLPQLVIERGESSGVVPSGAEAHRIVTRLALAQARALKKLAAAKPGRISGGQIGFLAAPGNMLDDDLRKEVAELTDIAARGSLATAKDAGDVLVALYTGVLTGISLPPELRKAQFSALDNVFTAKLRSDFDHKTGWSVAALFAIDGAYRLMTGDSPNLAATSSAITTALETDPNIKEPGLAALVASMSRYVVLAQGGTLGAEIATGADVRPERAAARQALERALGTLGDGGQDDKLVRDVADLADGTIATIATMVDPSRASSSPKSTCGGDVAPLDPRAKNALARLRDMRRTLFANPAWKAPSSPRARRLKLVALVLSDLMDAIEDNGQHRRPFALTSAEAHAIAAEALREWLPGDDLSKAVAAAYMLARNYIEHGKEDLTGDAADDVRVLLASVGNIFQGTGGNRVEGAAVLAMLAPRANEDFVTTFVSVASRLYAAGKKQEGDIVLLSTVVISSLRDQAPSDEALALARDQKGDVTWVLSFVRAVFAVRQGRAADPASFTSDMQRAVASQCGVANTSDIGGAIGAFSDFRAGKHEEARAALSAILDGAREKGLITPRYGFELKQATRTRTVQVTLNIGLAQGLVGSTNDFTFGAGAQSDAEPTLSLSQSVLSPDAKTTLDDSARYFVHLSALLAVYDFLDGDSKAGELVAARTIGFVTQDSWLGIAGTTDAPPAWAKESRAPLAILGELASESGRPFLAGDLFAVVKATIEPTEDLEAIDKSLADPYGLVGLPELEGITERARAVVHRLAKGLPCVRGTPAPSPDRATCAAYPGALALRVADATTVLPALTSTAADTGACADFAALDAFLRAAAEHVYDPNKFLAAVDALIATGKNYDATVLLTKHRREDDCSVPIVERVAKLADRMKGAPVARADLLTTAVSCSGGIATDALAKELAALDDELLAIGDPKKSAALALFSIQVSSLRDSWEPLEAIALKPGFVQRWESTYPDWLAAAIILEHGATILHGDPVRLDATAAQFDLLCGGEPVPDRKEVCIWLTGLRKRGSPDDAQKQFAKATLTALAKASQ